MLKNTLKKIRMKTYLMNKKEFAEFLGVSERQYGRYENATQHPTLETALMIANRLDKKTDDIWFIDNIQ